MEIDKEQLKENAENLKQSGAEIGSLIFWIAKTYFGDKKKAMPELCDGLVTQSKWGRIYASSMILKKITEGDAAIAVPALIESLIDVEKSVAVNAAAALGRLGGKAAFAIYALKNCAEAHLAEEARAAAESALSLIGNQTELGFADAVSHLKHQNPFIRRYAADMIAALGPAARNAVPFLKEAAQDEDSGVRSAVIKALGSMGKYAAPAASIIVEKLTLDDDMDVKQEAVLALLNMGSSVPGVKESLVEISSGSDKELSEFLLGNISKLGEDALPVLMKALKEGTSSQKRKAAQSLGDLGAAGKDALKLLEDALMSDDALLRGIAKNSMHKIKSQAGIF